MSYKIAGIDVHKKVLMVVVLDANTPEEKPERRRFRHHAERPTPIIDLVARAGRGRSGDGIDGPVLAVGVVGVRAIYAFAVGAGLLQPSPAGRKHDFKDAERLVRRLIADELILSFVPEGNSVLGAT